MNRKMLIAVLVLIALLVVVGSSGKLGSVKDHHHDSARRVDPLASELGQSRELMQGAGSREAVEFIDETPASAVHGSSTDAAGIVGSILNSELDPDLRTRMLAQLTEGGVEAVPALVAVAASKFETFEGEGDPHSFGSMHRDFEKGLRVTALEAVDHWAARGVDVRESLARIGMAHAGDADLSLLVGVALAGVEQGKPGKLGRFMDRLLQTVSP